MHPGTAPVMPRTRRRTPPSPDEANVAEFRRRTLARDEQRESRGAVGARLLRGKATAPRSWLLRLLPGVERERACAQPRMADPGSVADDLARAGCGSGQAWLPRPLGSRAPGTGPIVTSLARSAIRSPHLSPIVMSGSGRLRGFCDNETWIDRGTTSSTAAQRSRHHVIYGGAARRSYGPWAIGTSFGTLRTSVARSHSFRGPALRQKVADFAGISCDGETRTRTGDTTIFRQARLTERQRESPANLAGRSGCSAIGGSRYLRKFPAGSGHHRHAVAQTARPVRAPARSIISGALRAVRPARPLGGAGSSRRRAWWRPAGRRRGGWQ